MTRNLTTPATMIAILLSVAGVDGNGEESRASCADVRLDSPSGPFATIPVYNQTQFYRKEQKFGGLLGAVNEIANPGDISANGENICYAVADSELIDANRFSRGDKLLQLSSPLSIALNHKVSHRAVAFRDRDRFGDGDDNYEVIGPGNPVLALLSNQQHSVCDQRWLEKYASLIDSKGRAGPVNSRTESSIADFFAGIFDEVERANRLPPQI